MSCYQNGNEVPTYIIQREESSDRNEKFADMKIISDQLAFMVTFDGQIELWDLTTKQIKSSLPVPGSTILCHIDPKWGKICFFENNLPLQKLYYYDFLK
jgi:hypothetical protein